MQRIAVTGALGQLGSALCRQLGEAAVALDLPHFDMTDGDAVLRTIRELRPDAIINSAAYTAVDQAEQDVDICRAVNADGVNHLVRAAEQVECDLVQISTDYVFGNQTKAQAPYRESDTPVPEGVYARAKWQGEQSARRWQRHYVVRTCGLYGISARNNNFVETMLRLSASRPELKVVDDQHCTPTCTADLARAVLFLLQSSAPHGTYHIVNGGNTTWFGFAQEIFRQAEIDIQLHPITTEQYGATAPRPRNSILDTSKYVALGGPGLPAWQAALAEYLAARVEQPSPH